MNVGPLHLKHVLLLPRCDNPIVFFNVPGSVHDSQVAKWGDIYDKLQKVYTQHGGKCTVNSAFGAKNCEFLIKSSQDYLVSNSTTFKEEVIDTQVAHEATSMRQLSEWGMRAVQSSFPYLKDRFVYKERGEQRIALK